MLKRKLLDTKVTESSDFEDEVDPIHLLTTLNTCMSKVKEQPNNKEIHDVIYNQLKSFQIITIEVDGNGFWLTSPPKIIASIYKRTLIERISKLIISGGQWLSPTITNSSFESKNETRIPLSLNVSEKLKKDIDSGTMSKLLVSLTVMHDSMLAAFEKGDMTIGVFESPKAISNENVMRYWLKEHDHLGPWSKSASIRVQNLADILNHTILKNPDSSNTSTYEASIAN